MLRLWEVAERAGYPIDTIQSFTWRGKVCKLNTTHFNCVRLKTGELKEIPLTERP